MWIIFLLSFLSLKAHVIYIFFFGLNNPELNKSATRYSNDGIKNINSGYSTSRTCEIGMMTHSNIDYKSIAYLVRDYIYQPVK